MPTLPTNPHAVGDSGHVNDHNTIVTALAAGAFISGTNITNQAGTTQLALGAWTSYTPSFTGLTIGNSTVVARYAQIGKTVHLAAKITLGSTSAMGDLAMSLPVSQSATVPLRASAGAFLTSTGVSYPTPATAFVSGGYVTVRALYVASTYISTTLMTGTIPWTWKATDVIEIAATYEAA